MPKIKVKIEETIPTEKYANVKIGFELEQETKNGTEEDLELLYDKVERVVQRKRDGILKELGLLD